MFGFRKKDSDMATAQANILALMQGLGELNQKTNSTNGLITDLVKGMIGVIKRLVKMEKKAEENEKFVAECLTNNTILYDRINELDERVCILAERLRASEGDGTDF